MSAPLLLITGAPRSGTKLLRHLLNRHPKVALTTNETEFLPYLLAFARRANLAEYDAFDRLARYVALEDYVFYRQIDRHDPPDFAAWLAAIRRNGSECAFEQFIRQELETHDPAMIVGDKSPSYVHRLSELLAACPNARAVHIVRDPRAQTGSLRRVFGKPVSAAAPRWQAAIDAANIAAAAYPDRVCTLRYEDLSAEPEAALTRICQFLEIDFDPAMIHVHDALERYRPAAGQGGLRAPDADAFRADLSAREIAKIEADCARGMAQHGYRLVTEEPCARLRGQPAPLGNLAGTAVLAWLTVRRHGAAQLVRKLRLARARRRIMAGTW